MAEKEIYYTPAQKQAIISLIIEMVNADDHISLDEVHLSNIINRELGITDEIYRTGRALDPQYALEVVRHMGDAQKLKVGVLLTRVIDADEPDTREFKLLNYICHKTGIDLLLDKHVK